jgi:hypothetical protein
MALLFVAIASMTSPIAVSRVSGAGLKRGNVTIQLDEQGNLQPARPSGKRA